jgi:hypothetical protein
MEKIVFTIPQAPSSFDQDVEVKSFSIESDVTYTVNLHRMTCKCLDFKRRDRQNYPLDDIRRMCKHLMLQYYENIGLDEISEINRFAISNSLPIKSNFFDLLIESTNQRVFVNYWNIEEWWDIFLKTKNGWEAYKYVPYENDFAYGRKPIGVVVVLKKRLRDFYQWNKKRKKSLQRRSVKEPQGCATILLILIIVTSLFLFEA